MNLRASLMCKNRYDELLAIIEVQTDTAKPWGEDYKRNITGIIHEYGPIWEDYIGFWSSSGMRFSEGGKEYFTVNSLQVDRDLYGFSSWINIEDKIIKIILLEYFSGEEDDYYQAVHERNKKVSDYLERWNKDNLTLNDMRELEGLPIRDLPHLNQPVSAEVLEEMRKNHLKRAELKGLTYNLIV